MIYYAVYREYKYSNWYGDGSRSCLPLVARGEERRRPGMKSTVTHPGSRRGLTSAQDYDDHDGPRP